MQTQNTCQEEAALFLTGHKTHLTKKKVESFQKMPLPEGQKQVEITDQQCPWLKAVISRTGNATYYSRGHYQYRRYSERLGNASELSLETARKEAMAYRLAVQNGEIYVPDKDREITFAEALRRYKIHSQATKKSYKSDHSKIEKHFIPFFKEQKKLNALTEQDIQAYLEKLARTELGKSTQDRHIALLKAFEKYAMERQWINASFMGSIKMFRPKNGRTRFLSDEELGRFHMACRRHEGDVYRAFEFIASLGLRISEALNARLENWEPSSNTLYLEDSKTGPRFVTLNPSATAILEQQTQKYSHDGLVFRGRCDDRPMSYPAKAWKRVMEDAGLNDGTVTPHTLRHSSCAHLLMNGVDEFTVARLMGLSSTHCIHRHYGHLSNQALTAANAVVTDVINQSIEKVQNNEAA